MFKVLDSPEIVHGKSIKVDGEVLEVKKLRSKETNEQFTALVIKDSYVDEDGDTEEVEFEISLYGEAHKRADKLNLKTGRKVWLKGIGYVKGGDINPSVKFRKVIIKKATGVRVTNWKSK